MGPDTGDSRPIAEICRVFNNEILAYTASGDDAFILRRSGYFFSTRFRA
jgi:hypothetical protein